MNFLSRLRDELLDFVFPRSELVRFIESASPAALLEAVPAAPTTDDERTLALFDYRSPLGHEIVWELKYRGNRRLSRTVAAILYDVLSHEIFERALAESALWRERVLLVPIPSSPERRRERGYNPTELVGEALEQLDAKRAAERLFSYAPSLLHKLTHTESAARTHATKREREENLRGSMAVSAEADLDRCCIILLDDVTTSGATFAEARRALRAAGARRILAVAIAH